MIADLRKSRIDKKRVVVCSAGGLQAGDLAALLVRDFDIERVMTLPGLIQAMESDVWVLIIFSETSPFCQPGLHEIAGRIKQCGTRVLIFGTSRDQMLDTGIKQIKYFDRVPDCQVILRALGDALPLEREAY